MTPLRTAWLALACAARVAVGQAPDTATIAYDVNGVHVIQRVAPSAALVSANVYLLGGTQQLTPATAGIELLTLDAAARGSRAFPAARSSLAFQRTGSIARVATLADWTVDGFVSLPEQFDSTWAVVADRIVAPTLDSASIATTAARLRLAARRRRQFPDSLIRAIADSVVFAGHPYALDPRGTDESLARISVADVRRYAAEQFVTSRLIVVVVGPLPRARVEPAIAATLGTLPHGSYRWTPPPPFPSHGVARLTSLGQLFHTNYLFAYFDGPAVSNRDFVPFMLATGLLGGRISADTRRQNLRISPDPSQNYVLRTVPFPDAISRGAIYGMIQSPTDAFTAIRTSVRYAPVSGMPLYVWERVVDEFRTITNRTRESGSAQADALARAQIYFGDYHQVNRDVTAVEHADQAQVQAAANYYFRHLQFVYIGDPHELDPNELDAF